MTTNIKDLVESIGKKAKEAASKLSIIEGERKNKALKKTSEFIHLYASELIEENNKDIKIAIDKKLSSAIVDRLTLNQTRINDMITSINKIVEMEDPIGKVISEWKRPNGLHIKKISVPIGVIGLIYESRPNVTVDASAISIKSGNSLWRIAARVYGSGFRYTEIYKANLDQIRNPDLIYPGQVFKLPALAQ